PENAALHVRLGDMLRGSGRLDQSIAAYRTAIRLCPDDDEAHLRLGAVYRDTGDWDESIRSVSTAIALKPDNGSYHVERGSIYARLGRWELAASDYQWVNKSNFARPESWVGYAGVDLLGGDHESFAWLCSSVIEFTKKEPLRDLRRFAARARLWYLAARTVGLGPNALSDPAEAVRLAEAAVAFDPKSPWYLHAHGMAQYRAGQFDKAIETIQASMNAGPKWTGMVCNWLALALAHHRLGNTEEAKVWFDKAVAWIKAATSKMPGPAIHPIRGMHEHDSLACYVLLREAEVLFQKTGE